MRISHISLTARNADALAGFYKRVFGCEDRRPPKVLSGETVSRGNGLADCEIYSVWLNLPNLDAPFLEILEYKSLIERPEQAVNERGIGHISFEVDDILQAFENVLSEGGSALGEIVNFGSARDPFLIVYMRDPDGNVVELEQPG